MQGFILESTDVGSVVYTDEAKAYEGMPLRSHWAVKHSAGEYVKHQASTNGIESFWALMKRGLHGTYHHVSTKHLGRYVTEFCPVDTTTGQPIRWTRCNTWSRTLLESGSGTGTLPPSVTVRRQ